MRKNLLIITCFILSLSLSGCSGCNKKSEESNTDTGIGVINDMNDDDTVSDVSNPDDLAVPSSSKNLEKKNNGDIKMVASSEIFGKWATEDKSVIMEIVPDEMSPEEIVGDSYLFLSKDKSIFNTFRLESDKIVTNGVDVHMYTIENYQLHIEFDGVVYVMDRITDQEYDKIYDEILAAKPSAVEEADIPQEEILDTNSLEGLWVDVNRRSMLLTEDEMCSFISYKCSSSGRYQIGDDEGLYPNLLIINDSTQFTMNFSNAHLYLTNAFTGETIEMEKVKTVLYTEYRNDIFNGKY